MDRNAFLKSLSSQFYPILRAEGFRGSGNTLRRIKGAVVHVVNIQGSSTAKQCYLNLGAHLLFLPKSGGGEPDAASLKEYECVFRNRYDPPSGTGFGWSYGNTLAEMNESISFICEHWSLYGHGFFDRYSEYPQSFTTLLEEVDASTQHPIDLLTLARIARHLGDNAHSASLANEALKRCPERASDLRAQLKRIVDT